MKERLIKISEDMSSAKQGDIHTKQVQQNEDDSITGFLESIKADNQATNTERFQSASSLKRIGTFHSIFLKILKEDIEKLGMKYNKNF